MGRFLLVFFSSTNMTFPCFFKCFLISWVDLSLVLLLHFFHGAAFHWFFCCIFVPHGWPFPGSFCCILIARRRPFTLSFTLFLFHGTTFAWDPLIRGWPRQPCSPAGGHHLVAGGHSSHPLGTYEHKLFKGTVHMTRTLTLFYYHLPLLMAFLSELMAHSPPGVDGVTFGRLSNRDRDEGRQARGVRVQSDL